MGDGIGIDGGADVYDNIIDGTGCDNTLHSDGIQGVGSYWRIYNNVFHDHGQELFIETTSSAFAHVRIYNNIFKQIGQKVFKMLALINNG